MTSIVTESWSPPREASNENWVSKESSKSRLNSNSNSRLNSESESESSPIDDSNGNDYPTSRTLSFPYPTGPYPQQAALMDTLLEGIPRQARHQHQHHHHPQSPPSELNTIATYKSNRTRILALESPTGTGKSLSLACAGLAWLDHEEGLYYSNATATAKHVMETVSRQGPGPTPPKSNPLSTKSEGGCEGKARSRSSPTSVVSETGIDWLDSWQPQDDLDEVRKETTARDRELERHRTLVEALDELRLQLHPPKSPSNSNNYTNENKSPSSQQQKQQPPCESPDHLQQRQRERRENLLRMALTKSRMEERKRARDRNRKRKRSVMAAAPPLAYEEDDLDVDVPGTSREERWKRKLAALTPGTAEWLLRNPHAKGGRASPTNSTRNPPSRPPQILYAARTHSQLSQFVQEIRKTKWGRTLRVVALGSRGQGMCGELTNHKNNNNKGSSCSSASEARLTETCLELRKKNNGGKGCSHYASDESVSTLALHGMVEATDLEDLVALGRVTKTCSYYAARAAVPHAQLVVLPYASLCSVSSREALGLELHSNTLVLVDEAHNLPGTIANLTSATLALGIAEGARSQLDRYLQKYVDRLSAHHLRLLGDLKRLIRGLITSMASSDSSRQNLKPPKQPRDPKPQQRYLLSSSQFLVSQRLETINLFPLLRYMKESKLSQKLLGFMKTKTPEDAAATQAVDEEARIPSHISPMSVVETFLEKLTYARDDDGQVVVDRGEGFQEGSSLAQPSSSFGGRDHEAHLKFCVLNPAVHARDDLWTAPRAVALVGGTLQPLDVMMRELIPGKVAEHAAKVQSSWNRCHTASHSSPNASGNISNPYRKKEAPKCNTAVTATSTGAIGGHGTATAQQTKIYRSDEFWAFTCGHVVDSSQVLLQSLTRVGSLSIDVRHKTRSTLSMTKAIGTALLKLCQSVRHGMVVFLPSYKYEAILVDAWKKSNIWDQLQQATTVVREPKKASQVEATLALYSRAALRSSKGALLLSVVGGKLSEGINFADDLCRCVVVVGLPFADRSDPLLQEKLKLVAVTGGSSSTGAISSKAANDYYRSLCLRAVNQSVGRAIRHAKDWATIVLMDARYPSDGAVAGGLPSWLTESSPTWRKDSGDLEEVLRRTHAFFDGRQQHRG